MNELYRLTILGEPASKANSRKIVSFGGKPASIKSDKARAYSQEFLKQCPQLERPFSADLHLDIRIWYASRRPDLDESLILDLLQKRIYFNDRQVKSRRTRWGLDKNNPRTEIVIRAMTEDDYA
jgi:Holliday junction resolvase RusA-like endonuclease